MRRQPWEGSTQILAKAGMYKLPAGKMPFIPRADPHRAVVIVARTESILALVELFFEVKFQVQI